MPIRLSPAMLLTILQPWTDVVEPIYKRVAEMANAADAGETLWVGCGTGRSVLWWALKFQSIAQGLDPDQTAVEAAEERVRGSDQGGQVTFQQGDPANLPHEDKVFDTVIVHLLFLRDVDWEKVIQEATRVLRPMGNIVVMAPSWLKTPKESDAALIKSLGFAPRVNVEWKGYLRDAGAVEISVDEAAKDGTWFSQSSFTLLVRGWQAAGWSGFRSMLSREIWALKRLTKKRVLGLSILKGARWPHSD